VWANDNIEEDVKVWNMDMRVAAEMTRERDGNG